MSVLFNGEYRGNWATAFHGKSEAEQLARIVARGWQFTVHPGDVCPKMSGERAELWTPDAKLSLGRECWIAWETNFPSGGVFYPGGWNHVFQLHESGPDFQSNLAVRVSNYGAAPYLEASMYGGDPLNAERLDLRMEPGVLTFDHWYQFVLRLRFSPDDLGECEGWLDGNRFAREADWPTMYEGRGVYPKLGFYRGPTDGVSMVVHRNFKIATSLREALS